MSQIQQPEGINSIVRGTIIIIIISLLGKVLGFAREVIIAYNFGASSSVDAYIIAYTVPFLFMAIIGPSLSTVVIPVYNEYMAAGKKEEVWQTFSTLFTILSLAMLVVTLAGIALPEKIVNLLAPGLPEETGRLAASLTIIMLPAIIFMGLNNIFAGLLNANNIFGPSAVTPVIGSLFVILAALGSGIWGIKGLAVGTLLGVLAGFMILLPLFKKVGFVYRFSINLRDEGVIKCFKLILPVVIGGGIAQVYVIVNRMLASGLPEGSIAALNYANMVVMLPYGLYVNAMRTSIFPTLSKEVSLGRPDEMLRILGRGSRMVIYLTLPILAGFLILSKPIIQAIYQRGAFSYNAVDMTSSALFFYSFGLLGICLTPILVRGFHAMQDMRTPVRVALLSLLINIGGSLLLVRYMQHNGLALANSLATDFNLIALFWLLYVRQNRQPFLVRDRFAWFMQVTCATAIMAITVAALDTALAAWLPGSGMALIVRLVFDIGLGAAMFFLGSKLLRLPEQEYLFGLIAKIIKKVRTGHKR